MGRAAQKVDLILAKGKSHHLTKAEIERRKDAEIKLGLTDLEKLEAPEFIKNDTTAFKYWKKHLKEYKEAAKNNIEVLTTSDIGSLALYCKTYSEYENSLKRKQVFELNMTELSSIDDLMKLENAVNKKMDMLLKMQDRLFLNPLAKIKNVPKKEKEKPSNPMEDEFGI